MLIAQITDFHVCLAGELAFSGQIDPGQRLRDCIAVLNNYCPRPDLVLATGDLVNGGKRLEYEYLRSILDELHAPYFLIPGNHDNRISLRQVFTDHVYLPPTGYLQYTIDDYPLRLIGLDTLNEGHPDGLLCADRLSWLSQQMAKHQDRHTLIFMHHHPYKIGDPTLDAIGCRGASAMGDRIERCTNVERLVCGHLHRTTYVKWKGTTASSSPATAPSFSLSISPAVQHGWLPTAPGFSLHRWTEREGLVSFPIFLDETGQTPRRICD